MHPQRWGDPAAATVLPDSALGLVDLAFGLQERPAVTGATPPPVGLDDGLLDGLRAVVGADHVLVDDATRADLLVGARAFAYPSVYEGFGLPPLEAMALGAPVVATSVPALVEVLGDAALLVPPGDDEGLAAALRTAVADDDERRRLIAAGRERAAGFSWERAADEVVAALQAAVDDHRSSSS